MPMTTRRRIIIAFPLLLLLILYLLGPKPEDPLYDNELPKVPTYPLALESYVKDREALHPVRPDNEARIIWYDSTRAKTAYSVVYLHGFSASHKEGDPVHRRFAQHFGCNLFLARLADHGLDTAEALLTFTADRLWASARESLAVGEQIGEKVIVISTSSGGTLALMLAARYPEKVHALINLSPNIAINDPAAFLLNDPWGLQIARMVMGGKYRATGGTDEESRYWDTKYRLEALVELEELLESSMVEETFRSVTQPSLTLYYYKNENEQDPQVKVSAMLEMHRQLGTPDSLKVAMAMPEAGAHVIGSSITSQDVDGVYNAMEKFATTKLRIGKALDKATGK